MCYNVYMKIKVYLISDHGEGYVRELGRFDSIEDLHEETFHLAHFDRSAILKFETYCDKPCQVRRDCEEKCKGELRPSVCSQDCFKKEMSHIEDILH